MKKYNTVGHNLKRGIFNFSQKISEGFRKPSRKFIAEMLYGFLAGQSCFLTDIARKLNGKAKLGNVTDRLSRNLMNFDNADALREQYLGSVSKHFDDSTVLIIDDSDISKAYSRKLEAGHYDDVVIRDDALHVVHRIGDVRRLDGRDRRSRVIRYKRENAVVVVLVE